MKGKEGFKPRELAKRLGIAVIAKAIWVGAVYVWDEIFSGDHLPF